MKIFRAADLFCGAGGAAMGIHRAGFEVEGWDIAPQKHYPFKFHLGDALEADLTGFDFVWASPPCQKYSVATMEAKRAEHRDFIPAVRDKLTKWGGPYVVENVGNAPLVNAGMLCGVSFGLGVFRHRFFESNCFLLYPPHSGHDGIIGDGKYFSIAGGSGRWKSWGTVKRNVSKGTVAQWRTAMNVPWMTHKEMRQAIPPAYSEFLCKQVIKILHGASCNRNPS